MTSRALCVGINQFEHLPSSNWLNGCVNDANDMAAILGSQFGFKDNEITILTDAQATKAAVMGAASESVARGRRGEIDRLVFTLSSHGTQVPDRNGDEIDHADEAFVMYDIDQDGDSWNVDTVIIDDELHALLNDLPKGFLVEVVLDTCHSGTGLKSLDFLPGRRPRFLPPPTDTGLNAVETTDSVGVRDLIHGESAVLFAACRSDQTASDAHFGDRYNGAFTYYFAQALRKDTTQSRSRLLTAVSKNLRSNHFGQRPQLEAQVTAKGMGFSAQT